MIIIFVFAIATTPIWIRFFGFLIGSLLLFYVVFAFVAATTIFFFQKMDMMSDIVQIANELGISPYWIILGIPFIITLKIFAKKR